MPPLHTSPPQNYLLLPEKRDVIGRKFRTFAENCSFFFSGCENANKAKILCDIPASIAFVIPQRHLVREILETLNLFAKGSQKEETVNLLSVSSFPLHSYRQVQINLKTAVFAMLYQYVSAVCKYDLFDNEQS